MKSRPLPRLVRTLWYLRREQWVGQLRRASSLRPKPARLGGAPPRLRLDGPVVPWLGAPPHAVCEGLARIRLISREADFSDGFRWDISDEGPLFSYHLHQFDWARGEGLGAEERAHALRSWIADHRDGIGWDAGPISNRTFAWIKLLTTPHAVAEDAGLREKVLSSLADQLATLERRLERHLLANHYLWNLLALNFAGVALEGSRSEAWRARERALRRELDEQILSDGAHFERSPMYHSLLLENILDLLNALRAAPRPGGEALAAQLRDVAERMLGALRVWTCPDGGIALFADSAHGIAHPPHVLRAYAGALGLAPRWQETEGVLREAGYVRLDSGPFSLLATAAPPMPSYQPGHAHCDALSFVLSVGGERVVTDTGVYEYVPGQRRNVARATRSHSTVEIDGADQAELWAAHRVGGRPDAAFTRVEPGTLAVGVCAGWGTPEVLHRRCFRVDSRGVVIEDSFDVPPRSARMQLPLAPGLEPSLEGSRAVIRLKSGQRLGMDLPSGVRWRVERGPYFPEFGLEVERAVLVGEADRLTEARWRLACE